MAILRFFIYSNLFIAACAVLMVSQTYRLLLHIAPYPDLAAFIFFSAVCSYSFHWYLSPDSGTGSSRTKWQKDNHYIHLVLFFTGFAGAVIFFLFLAKEWFWLLLAAVPTFLYSAPKIPNKYFRSLRKIALGKTIFLALVWMYVTTILPFVVSHGKWQGDMYLFIISRFFMIYAISILFDYRDREEDKVKGIRSLITYFSEKGIRNLFIFSILIFIISTSCLLFYHYSQFTVYVLLLPGIITALLYNYARRNFSDLLYYFILDGLIALSPLLTLVTGI
ncbi:MAG TPA: UbiA family prenyltransferase [Chitinophagaceae bacterium]|nr:UbiA family prenyltransferase [Chitinophagaceae bacterium]